MNQTARIISIYAADTSGFCSALYEYGGMTVIHDASGCNSTYTTHDEPRWYDKDSMMYISGFTEKDAIMGNDQRFVDDLCLAANELRPRFVAICASPLPAMTGVDLEAIAYEVEEATGIPCFNVKTNGMQSYITGAGNAFLELARRFTKPRSDASQLPAPKNFRVNVLGLTPLDFPLEGTVQKIREWLDNNGHILNASVGIGSLDESAQKIKDANPEKNTEDNLQLKEIIRLADADISLVVSSTGIPLAKYLYKEYGIPYVAGVPFGNEKASSILNRDMFKAVNEGKPCDSAKLNHICGKRIAIIGESLLSASLANAIYQEYNIPARILESVGDGYLSILNTVDTYPVSSDIRPDDSDIRPDASGIQSVTSDILYDISCDDEDMLEQEIAKSDIIIADPLFEPICREKHFIRLPHAAFSGRCFTKEEVQLINTPISETRIGKELESFLKNIK